MTVAMEAINGLADGTYQFEAYLSNATGHTLDLAVTLVMVGNVAGHRLETVRCTLTSIVQAMCMSIRTERVWASGSDVRWVHQREPDRW